MIEFLSDMNIWHWMVLGLVLIGIEMLTGTFDLLMIAIAAALTGLFAEFAPEAAAGWQGQFIFFGVVSVVLLVLGRKMFANLRSGGEEHPTLNRRMNSLIGARGTVSVPFAAGQGKVRIGDTEWLAEAIDGADLSAGSAIIVEETESTKVRVRPA